MFESLTMEAQPESANAESAAEISLSFKSTSCRFGLVIINCEPVINYGAQVGNHITIKSIKNKLRIGGASS